MVPTQRFARSRAAWGSSSGRPSTATHTRGSSAEERETRTGAVSRRAARHPPALDVTAASIRPLPCGDSSLARQLGRIAACVDPLGLDFRAVVAPEDVPQRLRDANWRRPWTIVRPRSSAMLTMLPMIDELVQSEPDCRKCGTRCVIIHGHYACRNCKVAVIGASGL